MDDGCETMKYRWYFFNLLPMYSTQKESLLTDEDFSPDAVADFG